MGNFMDGPAEEQDQTLPLVEPLDIDGLVKYIEEHAKHIVVMAGAGISTSAGIPDFRSPGSGLYDNLQKYNLPSPQSMFEVNYFKENPAPFYDLVREMAPGRYKPTISHWFLRLLHDRGILTRVYTQNIDSLEAATGLPKDLIVAAHGNFDTCHALGSSQEVTPEEFWASMDKGEDGWRQLAEEKGGLVKPSIVFFGESLPERFFDLQGQDFAECDLLIVMGTSLQVQPFAGLTGRPRESCPRVLINRDRAGAFDFSGTRENPRDIFLKSDCDGCVKEICQKLGWEGQLAALVEG